MEHKAIEALIAPTINALGYKLWGCVYIPQGRYSLLRIYIDHENGINVEDCQTVSHQVSSILDVSDPIKGEYHLEVSSPGLDRPLFKPEQYSAYIGQLIQLRLTSALHDRRNYKGILTAVMPLAIQLDVDGVSYELPFELIEKAHLIPEF